eukprot:1160915-Pelagomonas_calceolata.AAC.8
MTGAFTHSFFLSSCVDRLAQERSEDWDYRFQASVLEIYNERIYDLLAGGRDQDGDKLDVKQVCMDKWLASGKVHTFMYQISGWHQEKCTP